MLLAFLYNRYKRIHKCWCLLYVNITYSLKDNFHMHHRLNFPEMDFGRCLHPCSDNVTLDIYIWQISILCKNMWAQFCILNLFRFYIYIHLYCTAWGQYKVQIHYILYNKWPRESNSCYFILHLFPGQSLTFSHICPSLCFVNFVLYSWNYFYDLVLSVLSSYYYSKTKYC